MRFDIVVILSVVFSGTRDQGSVLACVAFFSEATVDTFVQELVFKLKSFELILKRFCA